MLSWLAQWNNWPFLLALLVGMGLVTLTFLGFSKDADHGVDVDKPDLDAHPTSVLGFIGVGKIPLSILIEVLLVSFGLVGLLVNAVAQDVLGRFGGIMFPVSIGLAVVGSMAATRAVASLISRYAPPDGPTARRPGEFVGSVGVAASLVSRTIGQVRVSSLDKNTPAALLNAQVDPEWTIDEIARGTEVMLVGYDFGRSLYRVRPLLTD